MNAGKDSPLCRMVFLGLAAALCLLLPPAATGQVAFIRGDCNEDGEIDISDPVTLLIYNFAGGTVPPCFDACDADDDGKVDGIVADAIYVLFYIFQGGPLPPAPFPLCGPDPTADDLDCRSYRSCPEPPPPVTIARTSPADGEADVAVTRETIIEFSEPLADEAIPPSAIEARFGGATLAARLHVSPDRRTVTLFYTDGLPGSARVRVTVDGDALRDRNGLAVDADGDGVHGGVAHIDFDTLGLAPFPGTSVCGRVFASQLVPAEGGSQTVNEPLEGVTITVDGREEELFSVTDSFGDFRLENAPGGRFFVHIDGRTARNGVPPGGYYPFVGKAWESVPGEETNVGDIFLPLVKAGTLREVSETEDTSITFADGVLAELPELEGVSITVPAGALYADDGTRGGMVGIAPVPPDRLPGPLPPGLNFPIVITVQTDGATNFDAPVPVCFPNLPDPESGEVLPPGARTALWSFNHDTGRFEVVGSMTVSEDGRLVCSDPGVGIRAPGWHGAGAGSSGGGGEPGDNGDPGPEPGGDAPPGEPGDDDGDPPPPPGGGGSCKKDTDPVYLFSGEFNLSVVDLRIRGRGIDFIWARKYRSRIGPRTALGNGWDFSYNVFVEQSGKLLRVCDGNTRRDLYHPRPDGTRGRSEFFRELSEQPDGTCTLKFEHGGAWNFHALDDSPRAGRISESVDRNGNRLTFHYDERGRLVRVRDTLDRDIEVGYNADGLVSSVTDFTGRVVRYEYYDGVESGGSFGDLKSVTTPAVTGTPNGNDFPDGKTTTYTYTSGFADERLNHNLLTITDGRRNDPNDPTFGEGPYLVNVYSGTTDPRDPNFDRVVRQVWGGDTVDLVYVPLSPSASNNFARVKTVVNDRNGNVREYTYDIGNRLIQRRLYTGGADPARPTTETENRPQEKLRSTDPDFFETRFEWNGDSLMTRMIRPNGNITEYVYEADLDPTAPPRTRGNLRAVRYLPGTHLPAGDQEVIEERFEYGTDFGGSGCCGFNFVTRHVDGRGNATVHEYDERGNRVRTRHRIPTIIEEFEYNAFGQMTARVLPDNGSGHSRRDVYTYHEEGAQRGYRRQSIIDAGGLDLTRTYEYDRVGNVIRETDPRGHDTLYVLNQLDQVVRETSREVTDGSGIRYQRDYFYDANDNRIREEIQNIDDRGVPGENTHFATHLDYEILNYLVRRIEEVEPDHFVVTEYVYDGNRNRTLIRYGEATNGNQPTNVLRTLHDERDRVFRSIRAAGDPDQSTTQYDYDRNGNRVTVVEGLEERPQVQTFVHDGYDRLVESTDPMGNVKEYHYDGNHNVVRELRAGEMADVEGSDGNVRLFEKASIYDPLDRLIREEVAFFDTATQEPSGDGQAVTRYEYSDNSQITRQVNDNGHQVLTTYDTANRVLRYTDHLENTRTYTHDANNNITAVLEVERSDVGNEDQTFTTGKEYDNLDRLVRTVDSSGNTIDMAHDSRDNRTRVEDALGNITRYEYDGLDRLVRTVRFLTDDGTGAGAPAGTITTTRTWDDKSRLIARTDDNGNTTAYRFDALSRRVTVTHADGTSHQVEYDVHDNRVRLRDANGSVTTCAYDLLDRLVRKDIEPGPGVSDDTTFETYRHDGLSRMVRAEDDDSVVVRAYDSLSHVTREILNDQITSSTHDGVGNRLSSTYPGGRRVDCTFDELERKKTIRDGDGIIATYFYIGPDRVERRDLGNGTRLDIQYDGITGVPNPAGDFGVRNVIRTTHSRVADGVILDDLAYRRDRMYNKTRREDVRAGGPARVQEFEYDSIYRRIRSTESSAGGPAETVEYRLDGAGNRTSVRGGRDAGDYTLDDTLPEPADRQSNQYTVTPFDRRLHDANGNLVAIDSGLATERTLSRDHRNLLVRHVSDSGAVVTYAYDALGRRIARRTGGDAPETTLYFYDGWQVLEEQNENNETRATYVHGIDIDDVLSMDRGGVDVYLHADELLSVVAVSDAAGRVVERYEYGDYGEPRFLDGAGAPLSGRVAGNPYLFTGRRHDPETGFYYYRTRYLDPRAGRFASRDTIGIWGDPMALGNGFTYVGNNPDLRRDPMGLGPCEDARKMKLDKGDDGGVVCYKGVKYACVWGGKSPIPEINDCSIEHERDHFDDIDCPWKCKSHPFFPQVSRPNFKPGKNKFLEECRAYKRQLGCLQARRATCQKPGVSKADCDRQFNWWINTVKAKIGSCP